MKYEISVCVCVRVCARMCSCVNVLQGSGGFCPFYRERTNCFFSGDSSILLRVIAKMREAVTDKSQDLRLATGKQASKL